MLRGWVHSGFHVHRSRRVLPDEREDLQRLAQYIIRNPFGIEKMQVTAPNCANPDGSVLYRSGLNPKIQRPPRAPPESDQWVIEPWLDDPFPDYDTEPVMVAND